MGTAQTVDCFFSLQWAVELGVLRGEMGKTKGAFSFFFICFYIYLNF